MSAGRSKYTDNSSERLLSSALSPGCEIVATTNPASARAWAVSRLPRKLSILPWDMTTKGKLRSAIGQSLAAETVNGPSLMSVGATAHGYQTAPDKAGELPSAGTLSA